MKNRIPIKWIHNDNLSSILSSLNFILILNGLIILSTVKITGYSDSFYNAVPTFFWLSAIGTYSSSAVCLLWLSPKRKCFRTLPYITILFQSLIVLSSPYLCGIQTMIGGDLLSHVGMAKDIVASGNIDFNSNFYPLIHLLATSIFFVSGINMLLIMNMLAPLFSILMAFTFIILTKRMTDDRKTIAIAFLISSTYFLSSIFQPNSITTAMGLSIMTLPLLFYLIIRNNDGAPFRICLIILSLALVFFHPLTAFIMMIVFISLTIIKWIRKETDGHKHSAISMEFFVIAFVGYLFFLTTVYIRPLNRINDLVAGYAIPLGLAVDAGDSMSKLGLNTFDLSIFIMKTFGVMLILTVLSIVFIGMYVKAGRYFNKRIIENSGPIVATIIVSGCALIISITFPAIFNVSFFRFLLYAIVLSPPLASIVITMLNRNKISNIIITLLLITAYANSMFVIFPSPYIHEMNTQITEQDFSGSQWIIEKKSDDVSTSGFTGNVFTYRIASELVPYSEFLRNISEWRNVNSTMKDHFGYNDFDEIGDWVDGNRYIIIDVHDISSYTGVYENMGRLNEDDLEHTQIDSTLSTIYCTNEYSVILVGV